MAMLRQGAHAGVNHSYCGHPQEMVFQTHDPERVERGSYPPFYTSARSMLTHFGKLVLGSRALFMGSPRKEHREGPIF